MVDGSTADSGLIDLKNRDVYADYIRRVQRDDIDAVRLHRMMRLDGHSGPAADAFIHVADRWGLYDRDGGVALRRDQVDAFIDNLVASEGAPQAMVEFARRGSDTEGRKAELELMAASSALAEASADGSRVAGVDYFARRLEVDDVEASESMAIAAAHGWIEVDDEGYVTPKIDYGAELPADGVVRFNREYGSGLDFTGLDREMPKTAPGQSRRAAAPRAAKADGDAKAKNKAPDHVFMNKNKGDRDRDRDASDGDGAGSRRNPKKTRSMLAGEEVMRNFRAMVPGEDSFAVDPDESVEGRDVDEVLATAKGNVEQIRADMRAAMQADNPFLGENAKLSPAQRASKIDGMHKHMAMLMVGNLLAPLDSGADMRSISSVATSTAVLWALSPAFRDLLGEHAQKVEDFVSHKMEAITGKARSQNYFGTPSERAESAARAKMLKKNFANRRKMIESGERLPMSVDSAAHVLVNTTECAYDAMRISGDVKGVQSNYAATVEQMRVQWAHDGLQESSVFAAARDLVGVRGAADPGYLAKFHETSPDMLVMTGQSTAINRDGKTVPTWDGGWKFMHGGLLDARSSAFTPRAPMSVDKCVVRLGSTFAAEMKMAAMRQDHKAMTEIAIGYNAAPGLYGHGLAADEQALGQHPDGRVAAQMRCANLLQMMLDDGIPPGTVAQIHSQAIADAAAALNDEIPAEMAAWSKAGGSKWQEQARKFESERKAKLALTGIAEPGPQFVDRKIVELDPATGRPVAQAPEQGRQGEQDGKQAGKAPEADQGRQKDGSEPMMPKSTPDREEPRREDSKQAGPGDRADSSSSAAAPRKIDAGQPGKAGERPSVPVDRPRDKPEITVVNNRGRRVVRAKMPAGASASAGQPVGRTGHFGQTGRFNREDWAVDPRSEAGRDGFAGTSGDSGRDERQQSVDSKVNAASGNREKGTPDWRRQTGRKVEMETPKPPKLPEAPVQTVGQRREAETFNTGYEGANVDGAKKIRTDYDSVNLPGMKRRDKYVGPSSKARSIQNQRVIRNQALNAEDGKGASAAAEAIGADELAAKPAKDVKEMDGPDM